MEVNGVRKLVTDILQSTLFSVQQKTETHLGLEQLEDEKKKNDIYSGELYL